MVFSVLKGKIMKFVKANDIKKLLEDSNIYDFKGQIVMSLNNISVTIKQNDIIGNALQEWLCAFLRKNDIYFRPALGQTFPDFYLSEENNRNLCEMKTYYASRQPAFDIANFWSYIDSLREHPYRLDSDYLIFAYANDQDGNIGIKNIWCKKVWEITGPAQDYELKCQRKKGQIVNIRPANWKENRGTLKPFNSKEELLVALYKTYLHTNNQVQVSKEWLNTVISGYKEFTGVDMSSMINNLIR